MNKTSSASIEAIQTAIKVLSDKGPKPTQLAVSNEIGLSTRTIKKYWHRVNFHGQGEPDRVKEQGKRVNLSTPFERLKRRNCHTEIIPYHPWLNHIK